MSASKSIQNDTVNAVIDRFPPLKLPFFLRLVMINTSYRDMRTILKKWYSVLTAYSRLSSPSN